jgi:putative ABC transport system permease protein
MSAVLRMVATTVRRRRLQSTAVAVVILLASGVATIALTLMLQSGSPYDRAFAQLKGADATARFDATKVTPEQLRSAAKIADVSGYAGPRPMAVVDFEHGADKFQLRVLGRDDAGGSIDQIHLASGRWARAPGEIVISRSFLQQQHLRLGDRITSLSGPTKVSLVIVGEGVDVGEGPASIWSPQRSWTQADQVAALAGPGDLNYEMNYRFRQASTQTEIDRELGEVNAGIAPGAVFDAESYLKVKQALSLQTGLELTFLFAFGVFALGAAALIVANVVAGSVVASYREIGLMKAIGFTPGQVTSVFAGQMLAAALAGCALGIPFGVLFSIPLLSQSADAVGLPPPAAFSPLAVVVVLAAVLLVVTLAAAVPARRAGRLSAVAAMTTGTAPRRQRRSWLAQGLTRLGLPRPLSLGAGDAFARPVRGLLTCFAILIGVAILTFAAGFYGTMRGLVADHSQFGGNYRVMVNRIGSFPDQQVMQILSAQPQTASIVATDEVKLPVPGLADPTHAVAMRGDAAALGLHATAGRWFSAPGEVVAAPGFLKDTHLRIGDAFTGTINGRSVPLRIVGSYHEVNELGHIIRFDWSTLVAAQPDAQPGSYLIQLRPGANTSAYIQRLRAAEPDYLNVSGSSGTAETVASVLDTAVIALAAVLALIAIAGTFNTMLLNTREQVRDTAIFAAIGMSPGQVLAMVSSSACVLGIVGGVVGVPLGVALHSFVLGAMSSVLENSVSLTSFPAYNPLLFPLLALSGLAIALAGGIVPARWAARSPVAQVLRSE